MTKYINVINKSFYHEKKVKKGIRLEVEITILNYSNLTLKTNYKNGLCYIT